MCNKYHKVIFHQDLCEVANKKGKVVIIGHRIMYNCYAINLNSNLLYSVGQSLILLSSDIED